jgi:hypothetical protein
MIVLQRYESGLGFENRRNSNVLYLFQKNDTVSGEKEDEAENKNKCFAYC